jgi:hypothetical protein
VRQNHLLEPLQCLLEAATGALSEYEVIQLLQAQGWLDAVTSGDDLSLYSTHFLVYNALYQLQERYQLPDQAASHQRLLISALAIEVVNVQVSLTVGKSTETSAEKGSVVEARGELSDKLSYNQGEMLELRQYYLDWNNLEQASQQSVRELLDGFWQRFVDEDDYLQALRVLEVDVQMPFADIKQRYRQLAMTHHPDRGGDQASFQSIHRAFSLIQRRKMSQ